MLKNIWGDPSAKITFLRHFDYAFPSSKFWIFIAVHKICYTCTSGFCIMAIHISKQYFWYSDFWPKSKHQCWTPVLRKIFICPFQNSVSLKWFYLELPEDIQSNMSKVKEKGLFFTSSCTCRNDTNTQSMCKIRYQAIYRWTLLETSMKVYLLFKGSVNLIQTQGTQTALHYICNQWIPTTYPTKFLANDVPVHMHLQC